MEVQISALSFKKSKFWHLLKTFLMHSETTHSRVNCFTEALTDSYVQAGFYIGAGAIAPPNLGLAPQYGMKHCLMNSSISKIGAKRSVLWAFCVLQNTPKYVSGLGIAPNPAGRSWCSHKAPSRLGKRHPSPYTHLTPRLRRLDSPAFSAFHSATALAPRLVEHCPKYFLSRTAPGYILRLWLPGFERLHDFGVKCYVEWNKHR